MSKDIVFSAGMGSGFFVDKLKALIKSKTVLYLVVKTAVHSAFDRKLVDEDGLRKMVDDAIVSYKNKKK